MMPPQKEPRSCLYPIHLPRCGSPAARALQPAESGVRAVYPIHFGQNGSSSLGAESLDANVASNVRKATQPGSHRALGLRCLRCAVCSDRPGATRGFVMRQ